MVRPLLRTLAFGAFFSGVLGASGCEIDPTDPGRSGRHPSQLAFHGDAPKVTIPAEGRRGQPIPVSIATYGGGCIQQGDTEVSATSSSAEIRPFDIFPPPDAVCTADLRMIPHQVTVSFPLAGTATIRVHGVRVSAGTKGRIRVEPIVVVRQVVVR